MLTLDEFLRYAFFSLVILAVIVIAPMLYYLGSPNWLTRKFTHIVANSLAALYMVWVENLLAILFILNFGFLLAILLTLPPVKLLVRIIKHSTREDETTTNMAINATATIAVMLLYYLILLLSGLNHPLMILGGILSMSVGDGMGEVIGRPFGKHKFKIIGTKSVEGSAAVALSTFICLIIASYIYFVLSLSVIFYLLGVSMLVMVAEMLSFDFWDNIILPFVAGIPLYLLIYG